MSTISILNLLNNFLILWHVAAERVKTLGYTFKSSIRVSTTSISFVGQCGGDSNRFLWIPNIISIIVNRAYPTAININYFWGFGSLTGGYMLYAINVIVTIFSIKTLYIYIHHVFLFTSFIYGFFRAAFQKQRLCHPVLQRITMSTVYLVFYIPGSPPNPEVFFCLAARSLLPIVPLIWTIVLFSYVASTDVSIMLGKCFISKKGNFSPRAFINWLLVTAFIFILMALICLVLWQYLRMPEYINTLIPTTCHCIELPAYRITIVQMSATVGLCLDCSNRVSSRDTPKNHRYLIFGVLLILAFLILFSIV